MGYRKLHEFFWNNVQNCVCIYTFSWEENLQLSSDSQRLRITCIEGGGTVIMFMNLTIYNFNSNLLGRWLCLNCHGPVLFPSAASEGCCQALIFSLPCLQVKGHTNRIWVVIVVDWNKVFDKISKSLSSILNPRVQSIRQTCLLHGLSFGSWRLCDLGPVFSSDT